MLKRRYMKPVLRIAAGVLILLLLVVVSDLTVPWFAYSLECRNELQLLSDYLKEYIDINQGNFPKDEDELVQNGGLVKKKIPYLSGWDYYVPTTEFMPKHHDEPNGLIPGNLEHLHPLYHFEDFRIDYGANLGNVNPVKGKLYDKTTSEQIFLIDGPKIFLRKKHYQKASYELYQAMVEGQSKQGNE